MQKTMMMRGLASLAILLVCTACSTVPAQTASPPTVRPLLKCNNGGNPCVAELKITAGSHAATVDPALIQIEKASNKVAVFWQLPAGCFFLGPFGDGVLVKNLSQVDFAADQFDEQSVIEKTSNRKRVQISDLYYWLAKNTKKSPDTGVEYKVVFHCKVDGVYDPTPYVADPAIFNEGP